MGIEVEFRARFDQAKHDELMRFLSDNAEDLGENNKHIYFFVLPDKLVKVVHNTSSGTAKISLKGSRIGQGAAFSELEIDISPAEVEAAVEIFKELGFAHQLQEATNQRHDFRFHAVEIALKFSEAWGYHAELEILLDDTASETDKTHAMAQIHQVAEKLGLDLMTEEELIDFTHNFDSNEIP